MMPSVLTVTTLTDGGQPPVEVAEQLAAFLGEARATLDLALYDLNLSDAPETLVLGAVEQAHARGVAVRVAYNVDFRSPIPVPPPPKAVPEDIERLPVETRAIPGVPDLMHHKYVVRDGGAVWSGSANWTNDSWSREENVIVAVESEELALAFTLDFEHLWTTQDVATGGRVEPRPVDVGACRVRPWFCPGFGDALSHRIAKAIGRARRRVRIASPVITAGPVLGTLAQVVSDGAVDVAGVVDRTQVEQVLSQWHANDVAAWKIPLLQRILQAPFAGKVSTPWSPGAVHDYMHAKVTVADDVVFVGSFNLSRSGEQNAENVLEIHDPALAERLAAYVDGIRARYPAAAAVSPGPPTDVSELARRAVSI
jgi:phosphatidylserine/phosphatidylglycerophosphate/cardiolipin synthase-like enzyme